MFFLSYISKVTPLVAAARKGEIDIDRLLLKKGAGVNETVNRVRYKLSYLCHVEFSENFMAVHVILLLTLS